MVVKDTGNLDDTNASEEEVDGGEANLVSHGNIKAPGEATIQVVLRRDDHAPAGPDGTGGHKGTVLGQGELLSGALEVGDTGDDECPLSHSIY